MAKVRVLTTSSPVGLAFIQTTDQGMIACGSDTIDTSPSGGTTLTEFVIVDRGIALPTEAQLGSWEAPFKTLKQAITKLSTHGGTVLVVPGDYTSEGTLAIGDTDSSISLVNASCLWNSIYLPQSGNEDEMVLLPAITANGGLCLQGTVATLPISAGNLWMKYSSADNALLTANTLTADHSSFNYSNNDPAKFLSLTQSLCASDCQFVGGGGVKVVSLASAAGAIQIANCSIVASQTWICTDDASLSAEFDTESAARFSRVNGILTKIVLNKHGAPAALIPQSTWTVPAASRTKGDSPVSAAITVNGANPGDYVVCSKPTTSSGLVGLVLGGTVTAANTVEVSAYCLADCVVPSSYVVKVACLPASPWSAP